MRAAIFALAAMLPPFSIAFSPLFADADAAATTLRERR